MSRFARLNRFLQGVFPPSDRSLALPGNLSDDVSLVHPFSSPLQRCAEEYQFETVAAAAGVLSAFGSVVPDNKIRCVLYAQVFHDDPIARAVRILIRDRNALHAIAVQNSTFMAGAAGVAQNVQFPLLRGLWLPPGFQLQANVPVLGAPNILTLENYFVDYSPADSPLSLPS